MSHKKPVCWQTHGLSVHFCIRSHSHWRLITICISPSAVQVKLPTGTVANSHSPIGVTCEIICKMQKLFKSVQFTTLLLIISLCGSSVAYRSQYHNPPLSPDCEKPKHNLEVLFQWKQLGFYDFPSASKFPPLNYQDKTLIPSHYKSFSSRFLLRQPKWDSYSVQ